MISNSKNYLKKSTAVTGVRTASSAAKSKIGSELSLSVPEIYSSQLEGKRRGGEHTFLSVYPAYLTTSNFAYSGASNYLEYRANKSVDTSIKENNLRLNFDTDNFNYSLAPLAKKRSHINSNLLISRGPRVLKPSAPAVPAYAVGKQQRPKPDFRFLKGITKITPRKNEATSLGGERTPANSAQSTDSKFKINFLKKVYELFGPNKNKQNAALHKDSKPSAYANTAYPYKSAARTPYRSYAPYREAYYYNKKNNQSAQAKFVPRSLPFQSSKKNNVKLDKNLRLGLDNKKNLVGAHLKQPSTHTFSANLNKNNPKFKQNSPVAPAKRKIYDPFIKIKYATAAAGSNKGFSKGKRLYSTLPAHREMEVLHKKINNILNITKLQSNVIWDNYNELSPNFYSDVSRFLSHRRQTLLSFSRNKNINVNRNKQIEPIFKRKYEIHGKTQ